MNANFTRILNEANTPQKALKAITAINTNNDDGSKTIAKLFWTVKKDKLYTDANFTAWIKAHAKKELLNYSQSTIYNYIACAEHVLTKEWSEKLNFTQCYELTKAVKSGNAATIEKDVEKLATMTKKQVHEYCKQFNSNGDTSGNDSGSAKTAAKIDIDLVDELMVISEFINRHKEDKNIEAAKKALAAISEALDN